MAWTWNGLAKAGALAYELTQEPFLVKKIVIVADGATAEEAAHGELIKPDMVWALSNSDNPTATAAGALVAPADATSFVIKPSSTVGGSDGEKVATIGTATVNITWLAG